VKGSPTPSFSCRLSAEEGECDGDDAVLLNLNSSSFLPLSSRKFAVCTPSFSLRQSRFRRRMIGLVLLFRSVFHATIDRSRTVRRNHVSFSCFFRSGSIKFSSSRSFFASFRDERIRGESPFLRFFFFMLKGRYSLKRAVSLRSRLPSTEEVDRRASFFMRSLFFPFRIPVRADPARCLGFLVRLFSPSFFPACLGGARADQFDLSLPFFPSLSSLANGLIRSW